MVQQETAQDKRYVPQVVQGRPIKDIINGVVITSLIFGVSINLPIIGFFCSLLLPLPIVFYRLKLGRKTGTVIPVMAVVIMTIIFGGLSFDALFFYELVLLGFILSECIGGRVSVEKTVLYSAGSVLVTGVAALFIYSNLMGTGFVKLVSDYITSSLEMTLTLYQSMGIPDETIQAMSGPMETFRYYLLRILPALVTSLALFVAWMNMLMARSLLRRKKALPLDFGTLNQWKAPEFLVWGVIICGLMLLAPLGYLKILGFNGLLILMTIYFFQGIAVVSFFLKKKESPRLLKIIIYAFIALQHMMVLLVIGLGFFDMWLNFRKLDLKENNQ
jgi:uncharacterized protein YybS (DUF2232 family)